jgi:hypothetical protein
MRNVLGVTIAAAGAGLTALPFDRTIAAVAAGLILLLGALLLIIDWDGR